MVVIEQFRDYQPKALRPLRLFRNSRINSFGNMQWRDLFTGRALRNLELLRDAILEVSSARVRHALLIVLTASSGQMSKMVFAIEKRGKTSGASGNGRVEVGSWVIGFWRPNLHFEINVWNCFDNSNSRFGIVCHTSVSPRAQKTGLRIGVLTSAPQNEASGFSQ
jgi:hypothetical protein